MTSALVPFEDSIYLATPKRLTATSAWLEHIPFAMFLIQALKPRVLVELGTFSGESYCAFCQAVVELGLPTACYAVDSWKGDPHAGFYGPEVLADLRAHHDPLYGEFSQLMQTTFDEALAHFAHGSIDLLHIDGCHTYEAVKHDFESWLPKISARGVVLFHDIETREGDFGVWRFWEEVKQHYPHFEFLHGHGLGVLAVGAPDAPALQEMFRAPARRVAHFRRIFSALGHPLGIISGLQTQVESAGTRIQELTRDVELLLHERDMILHSKSWRLTAPLRQLLSLSRPFVRVVRLLRACVGIATSPAELAWLFGRAAAVYRHGGAREAAGKIFAYAARQAPDGTYDEWIRRYDRLTDLDREAIRRKAETLLHTPLISVIMPTYNTPAGCLRDAIDSVRRQLYPHWELCIADDASTAPHVRAIVDEARAADPRIKAVFRDRNGHISEASNSALALAEGEFVALLDHDDVLADHALYMVAEELNRHPNADLMYSDEDKLDAHGRRYEPYFKPDWSPDLFCSQNLISHLGVYRTSLVRAVGGFRKGYEGSQDHDLALRVIEGTSPAHIRHIPWILYHWRAVIGSAARTSGAKPYAHRAAQRAIQEHFERRGEPVEVMGVLGVFHRVKRPLPQVPPLVSVIIPTRDRVDLLRTCVDGILNETDYRNLEIIIVDNASRDERTLAYLSETARSPRVRVLKHDGPFNFSAMNNRGAQIAKGEILAFLNNDLQVASPEWLSEMVSHAVRPEVGAVGAMLQYPAGTIQHAGVVLGIGGVAGHVHKGQPRGLPGYFGRAVLLQNFSAVTAACMVLRRAVFEEAGRLDETNLAVAFNDVDLCLRIRELGYLIVWTPYAQLFHVESASRGPDNVRAQRACFHRETEYMRRRWGSVLTNDPYYNPNLTLERKDFSLAFPPRVRRPWLDEAAAAPLPRVPVYAVRS